MPAPRRRVDWNPENVECPAKDLDLLKAALWFIAKCNNLEQAERVFAAAMEASKKLEGG